MKTLNFLLIAILIFTLNSCGLIRRAQEKQIEFLSPGLDKSQRTFVMKNDSTIVPYDGLKIKSPLFGKTKFILDGGTEFLAKEIKSYQTEIAYYTWTGRCGWTPRVNLAPISKYQGTYTTQVYEGGTGTNSAGRWRNRTYIQNYIQKDNGSLVEYTPKNLYSMVSDYAPSVELLDEYFKKQKTLRGIGWLNTAAFVGGFILTGTLKKDGTGQTVVKAHNYIGLGLMGGSIVYGFVNRKKKRANYANVEMAYDDYNAGILRKRKK